MAFDPSPKVRDLQRRLTAFMEEFIYPNEKRHVEEAEALGPWKVLPLIDFGLAHAHAMSRVLRLADGPDEVHRNQIGKLELKKYQ